MKFWNYMMISVGLIFLFEMAGMPVATEMLSWFGLNIDGGLSLRSAALFIAILGTGGILVGLGVGLAIGYITKSSPENFIVLPFIITSAGVLISCSMGIINYSWENFPGWISYITTFIMGLLAVGFMFSIPDEFRGIG